MKKLLVIGAITLSTLVIIGLLVNIGPKDEQTVEVTMLNNAGDSGGTVKLTETKAGVLMQLNLTGLTPDAEHGFHVHQTAKCSPQNSFKDAGGHFNPHDSAHGMKHPEGQHAGDMPNLRPNDKGEINTSILNINVTLRKENAEKGRATLFDADGSSLMVHANADDHMSQPSGAAGPRILCGEIK